jgi:hypothetical protein
MLIRGLSITVTYWHRVWVAEREDLRHFSILDLSASGIEIVMRDAMIKYDRCFRIGVSLSCHFGGTKIRLCKVFASAYYSPPFNLPQKT